MQSQELASLESRLLDPLPIPIIGQCLQKKAVAALAEDRSPEAIKLLAKAVTRLREPEIKASIINALGKFKNRDCIDIVCEVWADTRHRDLANLLVRMNWIASEPIELKVITALKVSQQQAINNCGWEIVEPLLNAFNDRDPEIADRASKCAINLSDSKVIDYICQKWERSRDKLLEQIICKGNYIAQQPIEVKVLTALKVGNFKKLESENRGIIKPLVKALKDKDSKISDNAKKYICFPSNHAVFDAICREWWISRDKSVEQILCQKQYVAQQPIELKVLTALKTNRLDVIRECGEEVVRPLLKAIKDDDREIASRAKKCASSFTKSDVLDAICREWWISRDKLVEQILCQKQYVAQQPIELKVLTALKTNRLDVIRECGEEVVEPLVKALEDRDSEIASRAKECASSLTNPDAIDFLCQKWMNKRDDSLEEILSKGKYIAQRPIELKVLTALKTNRLDVIRECGEEVVEPLVKALEDRDSEIASRAKECASSLTNPNAIDRLCYIAMENDRQIINQLVSTAQYVSIRPVQKALSYFMTEQWGKYESFDSDQTLLQEAYQSANEQLRRQIADNLRKVGRVEWLKVILDKNQKKQLETLTCVEWETVLTVFLDDGEHWEELWQLAQKAPPIWSKQLIEKLKRTEFYPETEQEQVIFKKLKQIADKCSMKIPLSTGSIDCTATLYHNDLIEGTSLSPDGQILASYDNATIKLWQIPTGQLIATLAHETYDIFKISFSPDGRILASSSKNIKLWRIPDGQHLVTLDHPSGNFAKGIVFSPDGKLLASYATGDDKIELWQMPDGKHLTTLKHPGSTPYRTNTVDEVIFSPDGKVLASRCMSRIGIWKMPNGQFVSNSGKSIGAVIDKMKFSPDGKLLAAYARHRNIGISVYQMPDYEHVTNLDDSKVFNFVRGISFSPDSQILASHRNDSPLKLWRISDSKLLASLSDCTDTVYTVKFSPDGQTFASSGFDKIVRLYSMPDGQLLTDFPPHEGCIHRMDYSPNEQLLAACDTRNTIKLYNTSDGQPLDILNHDTHVHFNDSNNDGLYFSPDGQVLVSFTREAIKLWSSNLLRIIYTPIEKLTQQDKEFIASTSRVNDIADKELYWFKYMQVLLN